MIGQPVNLGNPQEVTVLDLAREIVSIAASDSEVVFLDRPVDDPEVRCPDISLARSSFGWEPTIPLHQGLERTIEWARERST